jgi:hypothetical protein
LFLGERTEAAAAFRRSDGEADAELDLAGLDKLDISHPARPRQHVDTGARRELALHQIGDASTIVVPRGPDSDRPEAQVGFLLRADRGRTATNTEHSNERYHANQLHRSLLV